MFVKYCKKNVKYCKIKGEPIRLSLTKEINLSNSTYTRRCRNSSRNR